MSKNFGSDRDKVEFEGEVVDSCKGKFIVKVNETLTVTCVLSGKIRMNSVKILVGDRVKVEVSEYDVSHGRIVYRIKN
jgi:translation initiation factor IF-1